MCGKLNTLKLEDSQLFQADLASPAPACPYQVNKASEPNYAGLFEMEEAAGGENWQKEQYLICLPVNIENPSKYKRGSFEFNTCFIVNISSDPQLNQEWETQLSTKTVHMVLKQLASTMI
mmetsp:Transcript_18396/g.31454  ORF Transcript_18396/g.31454 Transcript_18396/m.31454 type:complete len:120 (+) Transcript_18396:133-492(+)|eukprot:CAMPEP_0168608398 /NCGR_PEP_ID=MMETSP0449_2-20121227/605_1 /TAXON_ID=1082188 /ORGANISM="Strombidium rassoulzadegani, Strain ras09" /LENGTH=119 /DNA_ID=CAMNT_0008648379 /DNA_START=74 /DNA_END=433 /DNA_ORIENTATION=+